MSAASLSRQGEGAILLPVAAGLDAGLLRICEAWQRAMAEHDRLCSLADMAEEDGEMEEVERLWRLVGAMGPTFRTQEAAIAAIPARSMAGLRAKARIVQRQPEPSAISESLLADLLVGG